jgi:hypothetical protein
MNEDIQQPSIDTPKPSKVTKTRKPKSLKPQASKPTSSTIVLPTGRSIFIKYTTGRPSAINELIIKKLIKAFEVGATDAEACASVHIDVSTLWAFEQKYPEFSKVKNDLRLKPTLDARQTVTQAVKKNADLAFRYLERKARDEFGQSTSTDDTLSAIAVFTKVRKALLDSNPSSNTPEDLKA